MYKYTPSTVHAADVLQMDRSTSRGESRGKTSQLQKEGKHLLQKVHTCIIIIIIHYTLRFSCMRDCIHVYLLLRPYNHAMYLQLQAKYEDVQMDCTELVPPEQNHTH